MKTMSMTELYGFAWAAVRVAISNTTDEKDRERLVDQEKELFELMVESKTSGADRERRAP